MFKDCYIHLLFFSPILSPSKLNRPLLKFKCFVEYENSKFNPFLFSYGAEHTRCKCVCGWMGVVWYGWLYSYGYTYIHIQIYILYIYISRYSIFILTSLCNNRRNKKIESLDTESISTLGGGENLFKKLLHKPKLFTLDIFYECSTDSRNNWVVPTRDRNKVWRSLSSGTPTLLKCSLREDRNGERIQVILI